MSRRFGPSRLFIDLTRDPARSTVLLGSARSGTTKLAELLCGSGRCRMILEPLNTGQSSVVPADFVWGQYLDPEEAAEAMRSLWNDCLTGRLRSRWTDSHNSIRIATHRVIKCVASTNLVWWLRKQFDAPRLTFTVRHPFATAASIEALYNDEIQRNAGRRRIWHEQVHDVVDDVVHRSGILAGPLQSWAGIAGDIWRSKPSTFGRLVLRWCLENGAMLRSPAPGVFLIYYEHFWASPATYLKRLSKESGTEWVFDGADLHRPSRTDFLTDAIGGRARSDDRIAGWRGRVDEARVREGMDILKALALDRFYGESVTPLEPAPAV